VRPGTLSKRAGQATGGSGQARGGGDRVNQNNDPCDKHAVESAKTGKLLPMRLLSEPAFEATWSAMKTILCRPQHFSQGTLVSCQQSIYLALRTRMRDYQLRDDLGLTVSDALNRRLFAYRISGKDGRIMEELRKSRFGYLEEFNGKSLIRKGS
jgi:hypothetical protein